MAVYKHGVYVTEQPTGVVAPVQSTAGLQVVIGTAPINRASDPYHCTNVPILATSLKEATAALGYDDDYEKYTLCQSMGACFKVLGVSPVVYINVLDPAKHKKTMTETTVQVNSGVATVAVKDILLDKLVIKSASTDLTAGTDYTAAFDDEGYVTIAIIPGGKAASATSLTVSGTQIDPTAVTADDVVGGVNAQGVETGMEVIRQIYPALNMTPGILLAPGWSENATVAAGLQAKTTGINGVFRAVCIVDVDSSTTGAKMYTGVKQQKEKQAITSANCYPVWLYAKVGDVVYAGCYGRCTDRGDRCSQWRHSLCQPVQQDAGNLRRLPERRHGSAAGSGAGKRRQLVRRGNVAEHERLPSVGQQYGLLSRQHRPQGSLVQRPPLYELGR